MGAQAKTIKPAKFLIIGPAWVGDMVMSQSLYKLLKNNYPSSHITVLAPSYTLPLLHAMPEVDEALPLNFPRRKLSFFKRRELGKFLIKKHFTEAIVLPNSFKSALVPYFAKIPKRTGFIGEFRYGLLNNYRKLDPKAFPRMIDRFCSLALPKSQCLENLPTPSLILKQEWQEVVSAKFPQDLGMPVLAICPGAEFGPAKQWPAEHFAELSINKIKAGWQVWLFGSKKDEKIGQEIIQKIEQSQSLDLLALEGSLKKIESKNYKNYIGSTSLEEAMVLLSQASVVVSNDSGLMHIASALEKPVIALYGSTSADFTPPLSLKAKILTLNLPCQPCFQRVCPLKGEAHMACLNQLTPDKVEKMIDQLMLLSGESS